MGECILIMSDILTGVSTKFYSTKIFDTND